MIFEQHYLDCLSHASYLVGDETTGRAVVVDPQRDISRYLASAEEHGLRIERVIETHFHADFLSGHLELAAATGAVITFGAAAHGLASYPIEALPHGSRISLGEVELEILETPGHTPESISVLVFERAGDEVPYGVLTGDTLFIGDVGRPDLLASVGVTADELARQLYHSVQHTLMALPDEVRVYPAHGAGSACGKNLSTETASTIGQQKRSNYAMLPMSEDQFVAVVTEGQPSAPPYFIYDATMNKRFRDLFDEEATVPALSLNEVLAAQARGAVVLDTRDPAVFAAGHLRGSLNVGLDGRFAEYAGDVVSPADDVVLVTDPDAEHISRVRLGRIGFDRVIGALTEPLAAFLAHPDLVEQSSRLTSEELAERLRDVPGLQLVDVRTEGEHRLGALAGSTNIPLPQLVRRLESLDPSLPTVVYCAGGYRSSIGASTLAANGFTDVSDLVGGYDAWVAAAASGNAAQPA
jgi:hydroxyacylglutathione hydrolase